MRVFYGWKGLTEAGTDHGFGKQFAWDLPLLDGYEHEFLPNRARDPGSHHPSGIDCPDAAERISAWRPDALLVYGWNYRSHGRAMRYFHGRIPVLFRGDSTLLDPQPAWRNTLRKWWLKRVYRKVDYALYVGSRNREYYLAHGLKESQLVFAPHAVENERFVGSSTRDDAVRKLRTELGLAADDRVLMFVGKLESKKAPELLLDAFLKAQPARTALVFVGTGPLEQMLRARASSGSLASRVHFAGFRNQTELPMWYQLADCVALPSRGPGETWGLCVNEAMAAECAILVSDRVGCAVDLVSPAENGWVVAADDLAGLVGAIHDLDQSDERRLRSMQQGSARHISNWTIGHQVDAIVKLCEKLRKC